MLKATLNSEDITQMDIYAPSKNNDHFHETKSTGHTRTQGETLIVRCTCTSLQNKRDEIDTINQDTEDFKNAINGQIL